MRYRISVLIASAALLSGLACASVPIIPVGPQAIGHQTFEFNQVTALTTEGQVDPAHLKQCQRLYPHLMQKRLIVQYNIQGFAHERVNANMLGLPMLALYPEGLQDQLAFMSDLPNGGIDSILRVVFQMKGSRKIASLLLKGGKGYNCGAKAVVVS